MITLIRNMRLGCPLTILALVGHGKQGQVPSMTLIFLVRGEHRVTVSLKILYSLF